MRMMTLSGTPQAMGRAFGEALRDEIADFYRLRLENAIHQARLHGGRDVGEDVVLGLAHASLPLARAYDARGTAELEGIAEGAGLSAAHVLAMNGLTDFRDALAWGGDAEPLGGCSSFLAAGAAAGEGRIVCGQTWDLATDNMPYVIGVVRKPDQGPATWSLTTVGCLSLIGMNEEGLAIGTTNLRTTDARPGVTYLSIIHRCLGETSVDAAVRCITDAQRAGAHYYFVADRTGRGRAVECTATHHDVRIVDEGVFVHTNHALVGAHVAMEANTPSASSHARQDRLTALLEGAPVDRARAESALADRENGALAICRHDYDGISSNGAAVMVPDLPSLRACHGTPDTATWTELLEHQP